jgi:hypothetical protein
MRRADVTGTGWVSWLAVDEMTEEAAPGMDFGGVGLVALRCQSGGDLQLLRIVLVGLRQAVGNEGVWTLEGGGKRHCG